MNEANEDYYVRSVIELAEAIPVLTTQAIFSVTGIKLVNAGVRLNVTFFERFAGQSMLPPLEQCLHVENSVDHSSLVELARELLQHNPFLRGIALALRDPELWLQPLYKVNLTPPVVFLLTLAREQRPELLRHSVTVALLASYLGMRMGMSLQYLTLLAGAGMFHDLGELRIDKRLFEPGHPLVPNEQILLRTHPVISRHILLNATAYPAELVQAVAQHHERIDGSGFPFGLTGAEMNRYGRIMSIAEAVAARLDAPQPGLAVEFMLKLNAHQFDENLLGPVLRTFEHTDADASLPTANLRELHAELGKVGLALNYWQRLLEATPLPLRSAAAFIHQRLGQLALATRAAGLDPGDRRSMTSGLEQDGVGRAEVQQLGCEALQQVRDIVFEVHRRWPGYVVDYSAAGEVVRGWMEHMEELLLDAEVQA